MKRRLLSTVCALAILLGMLTVPTFAAEEGTTGAAVCGEKIYSSLQAAVDDYTFGVIVLQKDAQKVDIPLNVYLDTNGHNVAGVTVNDGATLYVSDTQTDDYTVADGAYGKITGISGAVQAAEGYLAITEEEAVSFHKVDLSLKSMALRPAVAGVYYNSSFAADEVVAANAEYYGVALSVVAEPTEENLETLCGYSVIPGFASGEKSGTLLTGIMDEANTAEENAENAATPVYGSAYIKTADGYVFGTCVSRDLKTQVEAIDAVFNALTDTQKSGIQAMYETYKTAMEDWNIPNIRGEQMGEAVITVPVQAENNVVTEEITVEKDGLSITIPFGALVEKSELTLTVTKLPTSESGIEAQEGQTLMPFDVHVDGVAPENTVPLTVSLGKVLPENLNLGNYDAYHLEGNGANEMTLVANDQEFTAHNQFKYTLEGELTLSMATFSVVTMSVDEDNAWKGSIDYTWYDAAANELEIRNADQLAGFGAIVGGMAEGIQQDSFNGKTVKLLANINLGDGEENNVADKIFHPIGYYYTEDKNNDGAAGDYYSTVYSFEGTFDGNGNTISNFYQNTWEIKGDYSGNYYSDAMGLFGYVVDGTVKNLNVDNFASDGEFTPTGVIAAYAKGNVTFENISITNCNPRVYNTGNGGIVGWDDGGDTEATASTFTYNNITIDSTNTISALWGSWDVACAGIQGYLGRYSKANFTNCHVAATIDVNNDVCGNYQYYWYRYCGMIIGTVDWESAEGGVVLENITATDCTVNFGDRHEYYYCELVANSLASYTHDHQFSRLTEVDSIDVDAMTVTVDGETTAIPTSGWAHYVVVTGEHSTENADCYHFNNGILHNHDDYNGDGIEDKETVGNVEMYVENNRHIFLPFSQLFGGYGWGVKGTDITEYEQIEITDMTNSVTKFEKTDDVSDPYLTGTTVTSGELFSYISDCGVDLKADKVQVTVSPATEGSTAGGIYTPNAEDWTQGTLKLTGYGTAKVTITDYYFCNPTELAFYVSVDKADANALANEMDFDALKGEDGVARAVCPACVAAGDDSIKEWKALASTADGKTDILSADDGPDHYYLANDLLENKGYYTNDNAVCVHLNGHDVTNVQERVFAPARTFTFTIMGDGIVTGNRASTTTHNVAASTISGRSNLYLLGGTYKSGENTELPAILLASASKNFYIYEGVTIEDNGEQAGLTVAYGSAVVYGGSIESMEVLGTDGNGSYACSATLLGGTVENVYLAVRESGTIRLELIVGGTAKANVELAEGAKITVSDDGMMTGAEIVVTAADGVITKAHNNMQSYVEAGFISTKEVGKTISVANGLASIGDYDNSALVFEEGTTNAYCTYCKGVKEWTALESTADGDYDNLTNGGHYYLSKDLLENKGYYNLVTDRSVCVHLNDHNVTNVEERVFVVNTDATLTIMGNGIVTGSQVSNDGFAKKGATISSTGSLNLIGGTYKHSNSELPTILQSRVNNTVNIYKAVTIEGTEGVTGGNIRLNYGIVNVYGATITGGTAAEGGNIYVYGKTEAEKPANTKLNIYGGTIDGNIYVCGNKSVTVTVNDDAKISSNGGGITTEKKITLGRLTVGAEIYVTADGAFTTENANAEAYLEQGYIKAADDAKEITVSGNVLYIGPKEEQAS